MSSEVALPPPISDQPPEEIAHGIFETGRRLLRSHPILMNVILATAVLAASTLWISRIPAIGSGPILLQVALILPLLGRLRWPVAAFCVICAIALVQWFLDYQLIADVALLIALYTIAVHRSRVTSLAAATVLEVGALMASIRWEPAGSIARSFLFITGTVVAAICTGFTVASGSKYMAWLNERARRLEFERDQQAVIAANEERNRIAREMHDIVSHSLSVVITLADAAAVVTKTDPQRAADSMQEVSEVGRTALSDMRSMLGLLRSNEEVLDLTPQPNVGQVESLIARFRSAGLDVSYTVSGEVCPLSDSVELTIYRVIQEALTNTLRHASAKHAWVRLRYGTDEVCVEVVDDGTASGPQSRSGHGIAGMRERAALHGGSVTAGPMSDGGWRLIATIETPRVPGTLVGT